MKKRFLALLTGILLPASLLLVWHNLSAAASEPETSIRLEKLDAPLAEAVATLPPDAPVSYIVHLRTQADLNIVHRLSSPLQRRQALVATLQTTAQTAQADLLAALADRAGVVSVQPLWIINAVAVRSSAALVSEVAARADVAAVTLDASRQYLRPNDWLPLTESTIVNTAAGSWGIDQVRAPLAWHGLDINGSGVTVAIMDSGVDWTHPALSDNYRGRNGSHAESWYDAIDGSPTPVDPNGHGTHVAGTAVGGEGLGVAPGAEWIGVRVFNAAGFGTDSEIHLGFQWLLAPDDNPALAPNVVNGSWGGAPMDLQFMPDVQILRDAGILPIFAAGNSGSFPDTITAPASYPDTLAVGASEPDNRVAWFSSRGESPITHQTKPTLVAPGVNILSSLPGGVYGLNLGTSMAAPHVSGAAALVLDADPALTPLELMQVLTQTARPLSPQSPNMDSGYGLLDSYAAVAARLNVGVVAAVVRSQGQPLANTPITITTSAGQSLPYVTDAAGQFTAPLGAGSYQVTADVYGHHLFNRTVIVVDGYTSTVQINLARRPMGRIAGIIQSADAHIPIAGARIRISDTPLAASSGADGSYELELLPGTYMMSVAAVGYQQLQIPLTVALGAMQTVNIDLPSMSKLLLVDSGPWYYESQVSYYEQAMADSGFSYDLWSVHDPYQDAPSLANLLEYDAVVWTAPYDAPGLLSNGSTNLYEYLQQGGQLLISGQDVAWNDAVGYDAEPWFADGVAARYGGVAAAPFQVSGAAGTPFASVLFQLNGSQSADNQETPDWVTLRPLGRSEAIMFYSDGQAAAIRAGFCQEYSLIYLGFGLEGVSSAAVRAELLQRSLETMALPPRAAGVQFEAAPPDDLAPPGATLTYTVQLRNRSELITDTFDLALDGDGWNSSLITTSLTIGPCQADQASFTVTVPVPLPPRTGHTVVMTATSQSNAAVFATLRLTLQTPAHVLLVDDDRWYNREMVYRNALDGLNVPYDTWDIGWDNNVRGSPSKEVLSAYDIVIWFTGYDWYRPITTAEMEALQAYLEQGGRLFLSSQDYVYYHLHDALTRDFLGITSYQESITPTLLFGGGGNQFLGDIPDAAPAWSLDFGPYQNFGDGVMPASSARVHFWHNGGMPGGIANQGADWRTVFWGLPFETLPEAAQGPAMNRIVGWLSDLGDSTFASSARINIAGAWQTYTLTLRTLDLGFTYQVNITNPLLAELTPDVNSLSQGAVYDAAAHEIRWQGTMPGGSVQVIRYRAMISADVAAGIALVNPVAIHYHELEAPDRHALTFERNVITWIDVPDYSQVTLTTSPAAPHPTYPVKVNLELHAPNMTTAAPITVTLMLPPPLFPLTATLQSNQQQPITVGQQQFMWAGTLSPGAALQMSLMVAPPPGIQPLNLPISVIIEDGITSPIVQEAIIRYQPHQLYQPLWLR
ncbi:MAG: hypothetical protein Fur0021_08040 [Candidatus Promineifilaceae bacterium]